MTSRNMQDRENARREARMRPAEPAGRKDLERVVAAAHDEMGAYRGDPRGPGWDAARRRLLAAEADLAALDAKDET